ncbi:hypothetical protein JW879_07555 [candidate division WOR-3 bacterium]|nr:hypothetical protein [candidate division WOR-3 bacterium]
MLLLIFLSYSFSDLKNDISDLWDGLNRIGGPTDFEILQLDMHAKTNSTAGNCWEGGVNSLLLNPSEIMHSSEDLDNKYNFSFTFKKMFLDMNANFVGVTRKSGNNAFGFSFLGFYSGDMELRDESPGIPIGDYSGDYLIFGATYARSFGNLSFGGTLRSLKARIFEVSYSTYSFDLGMSRSFKAFNDKDFRFDLSFMHLGPKFFDDAFRLPLTWHVGLKGSLEPLFLGFSINKPLNTKLQYTIGGELKIKEYFFIQAGTKVNNPLEKYSFGWGLRKDNLNFNYSYAPTNIDIIEGSHLFTISMGI